MCDFSCFLMLKDTNNINYIHSTSSLGSQVSGAHIQVEMDLISHNSTRDVGTWSFDILGINTKQFECINWIFCHQNIYGSIW